jgi:hypothetical protein
MLNLVVCKVTATLQKDSWGTADGYVPYEATSNTYRWKPTELQATISSSVEKSRHLSPD